MTHKSLKALFLLQMKILVKKCSGMALVSVILMSALLITLYLRFANNANLVARIDSHQNTAMQNRLAARAGIDFALALLSQSKTSAQSYADEWKTVSEQTIENPVIIGVSSFTLEIIDESGKANVNMVTERFLTELFTYYDLGITKKFSLISEELEIAGAKRLAHRILDYIDESEDTRPLGLSSAQYVQLGYLPPKNAPLRDIRELLNIPGITDELFNASGTRLGLSDILTVYGEGKININTAPEGVVRAVWGLPDHYSRADREDFYQQLFSSLPFIEVAAFSSFIVDYDKRIQRRYTEQFMTATSWFKVISTATSGDSKVVIESIIHRDIYGDCHILRMTEIP